MGKRLKTIRKFLHLNQEIVSQKMQITKQTLSRYENGIRFPDSFFLEKFGRLFNVNANWLLYGTGDMFVKDSREFEIEQGEYKRLQFYLKKIEELFLEKKREK